MERNGSVGRRGVSDAPAEPAGRVGRRFLTLGLGEAAARLIAFAATVYLARRLGADVYGIVVLAAAVLLYATCVTDCGVSMLGVRDVAHEPGRLSALLPELLGARLVVGFVLVVLLAGGGLLLLPSPDGPVLALYALLLLPAALSTRWVYLGLEQSGPPAAARVLSEALAALVIVGLVHGPADVLRAPLALLLGEIAGTLLLLRLLPRGVLRFPRFQPDAARALFPRAWPLVAHTLLGLLIFNSDFFFLRGFFDSGAVGRYAVAYTVVSFFLNLGATYEQSLLPAITRLGAAPVVQRQLYQSALAQVFAVALPIALGGFLLAGPLLTLVFGSEYGDAARPLAILVWSIPIALFRNVAQTALISHGRQNRMLRTAAWAAGANLLLNAAVIPLWGMAGAAAATVATEAIRAGLALRFAAQDGLVFSPFQRFWRPVVAGAAMVLTLLLLGGGIGPVWLAVGAGGAVYLAVLYLVGGLKLQARALPQLTV